MTRRSVDTVAGLVLASTVAVFVTGIDRITKAIVCRELADAPAGGVPVVQGILHLTPVFNKGAAFGLLKDRQGFFIALAVAVIVAVLVSVWRATTKDRVVLLALGLILGGAVGNLIDRLSYGYVIDFIDLRVWPVFNVADSAITTGAAILGWKMIFNSKRKT